MTQLGSKGLTVTKHKPLQGDTYYPDCRLELGNGKLYIPHVSSEQNMYYLDLFQLYKPTTKQQRIAVRDFNRDIDMARRLKLQRNHCYFCNIDITMADHLDHLTPVYYGGRSNKGNLVAACRDCNLLKSTGQIEITNPYTIKDYLGLIEAKRKWQLKLTDKPWLRRYPPKKVRLYGVYKAHLFKEI